MIVNAKERKRIEKLVASFMSNNNITQYSLNTIIYIDDNHECDGTIYIDSQMRSFTIRIWTHGIYSYRRLCEVIIHELTHLYFHEINDFINMLERHEIGKFVVKEAAELYETITYKTSKIFESIYLTGL
jgi:hypothetical protein